VIHVGVRDDHVAQLCALRLREAEREAAGVNGHAVVDQVGGQTLLRGDAAVAVERAGEQLNLHRVAPGITDRRVRC
jgi:hypothetical protein